MTNYRPLTSRASVRNFSGANNDNNIVGRKMMRFNYSSGVPTPLCVVCHK